MPNYIAETAICLIVFEKKIREAINISAKNLEFDILCVEKSKRRKIRL